MTEQSDASLQLYDEKCKNLLKEPEIRFAGIISKEGKLVLGGFKEGLTPYENDETKLQAFPFPISQIALLISAEPTINIENLAKKVVEIFTSVK